MRTDRIARYTSDSQASGDSVASDIRIHVLIVNYNTSHYLAELVPTLNGSGVASVTLFDNGSDSANLRIFNSVASENETQAIVSETNLGFGSAINMAASQLDKASDEDYFWILNPDILLTTGAIERLKEVIRDQRANILSPIILTGPNGDVWFSGGSVDVRKGMSTHFAASKEAAVYVASSAKATGLPFITGAAMLINAGAFRKLRGFRQDLFLYWEDADLCIRAAIEGLSFHVDFGSQIWHEVGASQRATNQDQGKSACYYYYYSRNRLLVCGRHFPAWRICFINGGVQTLRIFRAAAQEENKAWKKLLSAVTGTIAGLTRSAAWRFGHISRSALSDSE